MTIPSLDNILLFSSMAALLIVIPGPAVLYIMAKTAFGGYKAGFISVLGIGLGALVHVTTAALGVSAILVASATAFTLLKYAGAFYLIYLGIRKLLDKPKANTESHKQQNKSMLRIFLDGMIINILNPKTAIFFLAFLPQFISIEKGHPTSQILFLGLIFITIAAISNCAYVLASGKVTLWVKNNSGISGFNKYAIASVYILLGIITLFINPPESSPDLPEEVSL